MSPLLLLFPPFFRKDRLEALSAFLEALPREFRYAVELRHAEWHAEPVLELLTRLNMAWAAGVGPDSPAVRPLTADFAYLPFGGGARKCVGDQFAMMEATVALAGFLQRFDFDFAGPTDTPDKVGTNTGATIHTRNGLWMTVTERAK